MGRNGLCDARASIEGRSADSQDGNYLTPWRLLWNQVQRIPTKHTHTHTDTHARTHTEVLSATKLQMITNPTQMNCGK